MQFPEQKALDITTQIVVAKLHNSDSSINAVRGQDVAAYFKAIYESVQAITSSITD